MLEAFISKNHEVGFGFVQLEKVFCGPVRDRVKTRGYIRKKICKFRVSRKDSKTKVVISIAHTVKTSIGKSIRQRGTVKVKEEGPQDRALGYTKRYSKRRREATIYFDTLCAAR